LAFVAKRTNTKFLSAALGFSGGVMIYVSFVEIFPKAHETLAEELGKAGGYWVTVLSFFAGIIAVGVIDKLVPDFENPHEVHRAEEMREKESAEQFRKLYRMGLLAAIAIAVHNFPEGIATFVSALKDKRLGVAIGIAIAIHNIPEGIAVSIPIYYATGSRKKAFIYSFLSGLAEPLGALIGYVIISLFFSDVMFGVIFAAVAGIMVFISLDELLPTAREYGHHHLAAYGLVGGMAVMALSLLLFV
ncbi:MAG: zinc transporter ZupT, partial [Sedimentisphaerales bacterium]|nr:zinc transporter ZupT [Sedimentisphaerales bacterium]